MLYPIVFLSGYFISAPFLDSKGVPFWLSLFVGNLFSTQLLGWLAVPVIFPLFGCGTLEAGRRLRIVTDPLRDLYGGLRLASLKGKLVHRLAYNDDVVAFKMGRRQGGPSRTGGRGRIPHHFTLRSGFLPPVQKWCGT